MKVLMEKDDEEADWTRESWVGGIGDL